MSRKLKNGISPQQTKEYKKKYEPTHLMTAKHHLAII
jgi:hypothetical protein